MTYQLNRKQRNQLSQPKASEVVPNWVGAAAGIGGYHQTVMFHTSFDMPVKYAWDYSPTVSERLLRGRLLMEEVLETLEAMGLGLVHECNGGEYSQRISPEALEYGELSIQRIEGSKYDPIETADGLADIKVIANGTAVAFGIPMGAVDHEVFYSNMTKLDVNGRPIVNRCADKDCLLGATFVEGSSLSDCDDPAHLIDSSQPIGKVLKPDNYTPANIARLYVEYTKQGE